MKNVLYFLIGGGLGALAMYFAIKNHYERCSTEEIESVREAFKNRQEELEKYNKEPPVDDLVMRRWDSSVKFVEDVPYVIEPEEFGEMDDYEKILLTYYDGDGVLADDNYDRIDDPDVVVGDAIAEFEDTDVVYVRNDNRKIDYEITLDEREYTEAMKAERPWRHDDEN